MAWERLASVTLGSSNATLSSGTFSSKKHLTIIFEGTKSGSSGDSKLTYNADTDAEYTEKHAIDGGSSATETSQNQHDNLVGGSGASNFYTVIKVLNLDGQEKLAYISNMNTTAGAGNAPSRTLSVGKFIDTSPAITSCELTISGGDTYGSGSTVTVWGTDVSNPKFVAGSVFEESDTGKHYMFDGSSSWDLMA